MFVRIKYTYNKPNCDKVYSLMVRHSNLPNFENTYDPFEIMDNGFNGNEDDSILLRAGILPIESIRTKLNKYFRENIYPFDYEKYEFSFKENITYTILNFGHDDVVDTIKEGASSSLGTTKKTHLEKLLEIDENDNMIGFLNYISTNVDLWESVVNIYYNLHDSVNKLPLKRKFIIIQFAMIAQLKDTVIFSRVSTDYIKKLTK